MDTTVNDRIIQAIRNKDLVTLSSLLDTHSFPPSLYSWMWNVDMDTFSVIVSHFTAETIPSEIIKKAWSQKTLSGGAATQMARWNIVEKIIAPKYFDLDTEEKIGQILSRVKSLDQDVVDIMPVRRCDPILMLRYGFMPRFKKERLNTSQFMRYMGVDEVTRSSEGFRTSLNFWSGDLMVPYIDALPNVPVWIYRPMKYYIDKGEMTPSSVPLIFSAPHQIYPSGRPKTTMNTFYSPKNHIIKRDTIVPIDIHGITIYRVRIGTSLFHGVPVTRYIRGMSKGLFYKDRPKDVCGTFYYLEGGGQRPPPTGHEVLEGVGLPATVASLEGGGTPRGRSGALEPASDTLLLYKSGAMKVYFNKTDAMRRLGQPTPSDPMNLYDNILEAHTTGQLPSDLYLSPQELTGYLGLPSPSENIAKDRQYAGVHLNLYASEDKYDQPLCKAAQEQGIDIVILTHMVGSFQVVSEVLDTRANADSYDSLAYIK
jgi:hypothetical protein